MHLHNYWHASLHIWHQHSFAMFFFSYFKFANQAYPWNLTSSFILAFRYFMVTHVNKSRHHWQWKYHTYHSNTKMLRDKILGMIYQTHRLRPLWPSDTMRRHKSIWVIQWLLARRHQAIAWTNLELSSVTSNDTHLEMGVASNFTISLKSPNSQWVKSHVKWTEVAMSNTSTVVTALPSTARYNTLIYRK